VTSDASLAALAGAAYSAAPTWQSGDVHACLTETPDGTVLAFRGTVPDSISDWVRDFDAVPAWRPHLGFCHRGFLDGALAVWPQIQGAIHGRRIILTGHSLGGALALVTAGLMAGEGASPALVVTFGAPRAAAATMASLLSPVAMRQYHNGNDPVPDVPAWFRHMRPLIQLGVDEPDPIDAHSIALYSANVATYEASCAAAG